MNRKKIFVGLLGAVLVALFASTSVKAQAGFQFGDAPNVQAAADGSFTMTFTVKNLSVNPHSVDAYLGPIENVTDASIFGADTAKVKGGGTQKFVVRGRLTDLTKDGSVTLKIVFRQDGNTVELTQPGTVKKPERRPQRNR